MHVFLIAAITADGFIAKNNTDKSTRWTSREDFEFFTTKTKQAGLLVMGSTTYQTIGRPLKDRITIICTHSPKKILNSQDISQLPDFSTPGVKVPDGLNTPGVLYTTSLEPKKLIEFLSDKKYPELAICGGSSIYTQFMKIGLVNTLYLTTHTNIVFKSGTPLFDDSIHLPQPTKTIPLSPTTILNEYHL